MRSLRAESLLFLVLGLTCASASIAQTEGLAEELIACAKIADKDTRFDCYEGLGERVLQGKSSAEKPMPESVAQPVTVATTVAETTTPLLPDNIGGSKFGAEPVPSDVQYKGHIKSCEKGYYGNWIFFFDNGQVWKEVNNRRLRFRDCDFDATISKDTFGYKMMIDGQERSIRVSRSR